MSLRPLRFGRGMQYSDGGVITGRPAYGRGSYTTDCGRFIVRRLVGGQWRVMARRTTWARWLYEEAGIDRDLFDTRKGAVAALEEVLAADGLLEAEHPA